MDQKDACCLIHVQSSVELSYLEYVGNRNITLIHVCHLDLDQHYIIYHICCTII